jgi:hypothetical protein
VSGLAVARADPHQRRAAYALRAEAAVEAGWLEPDELPDGLERDAADERAVQIVALAGGRVVGTLRVASDPADVAAELLAHDVDLPVDGTVLAGRLVVARDWRARSREVTVGLYAEMVRVALEAGAVRGLSFVTESAVRWYRLAGIPLKLVGPPRPVTGVMRSPAVFDVEVLRAFLAHATPEERRAMPDVEGAR